MVGIHVIGSICVSWMVAQRILDILLCWITCIRSYFCRLSFPSIHENDICMIHDMCMCMVRYCIYIHIVSGRVSHWTIRSHCITLVIIKVTTCCPMICIAYERIAYVYDRIWYGISQLGFAAYLIHPVIYEQYIRFIWIMPTPV